MLIICNLAAPPYCHFLGEKLSCENAADITDEPITRCHFSHRNLIEKALSITKTRHKLSNNRKGSFVLRLTWEYEIGVDHVLFTRIFRRGRHHRNIENRCNQTCWRSYQGDIIFISLRLRCPFSACTQRTSHNVCWPMQNSTVSRFLSW